MRSDMVAAGLLLIALGQLSFAQDNGGGEVTVRVAAGAPLTVECALRVEQPAVWRRDGGAPPHELRASEAAGAALTARLHVAAARAHHAGVYTCAPPPDQQRVRVVVLPATADADGSSSPPPPPPPAVPTQQVQADVGKRDIMFDCSPPAGTELGKLLWYKNGTEVSALPELGGRYKAVNGTFNITDRAREDDFGRYDCRLAAGATPMRAFQLAFNPYARLPPYTNVVEEQKLRITCRLVGKPYREVEWRFSQPGLAAFSDVKDVAALAGRYQLADSDAGVKDGDLIVEEAAKSDAGNYTCAPSGASNTTYESFTVVLVKDKYAALWPFLGICLEVLVLCVIILVYEKRRPKHDLEDSDTDNHDQ